MENAGSTPVNTAEPFVKMFETIDEEVLLDDNDVTFNWLVYS